MQTQKPQRAAIPSAGRRVPFSLMQPFQWDGEELADTSTAALQDPRHCISERSKTITLYFYLPQMWAAMKAPAAAKAGYRALGSNSVFQMCTTVATYPCVIL